MGHTRDMAYIALFTALMAVCTWIAVPTQPPFTLQIFAVFAAALCLGARRAVISVGLYLALGILGLPVFAGFGGGLGHLLGPSGGFVFGFLPAAWIAGGSVHGNRNLRICGCAAGLLACYVCGTLWYVLVYSGGSVGIGAAAAVCVLPFLLPDICKIVLALAISRIFSRHIR